MDPTTIIADVLAGGHAVQFQVRGDSMHPLIRENDYLHVAPVDRICVGDVVLILAERGLTAHRVIARRGGMVITRGDNAPAADHAVAIERVLGKVIYILREGKRKNVSRSAAAVAAALVRRLRRWMRERRHPAGRSAAFQAARVIAGWKPADRPAGSRRSES